MPLARGRTIYDTAMRRPRTAFDRYFDEQMKSPAFAAEYRVARAEIDAVDKLVRALDAARIIGRLSKADLARRIRARPEMIRRLLTSPDGNPTIETVLQVAGALGYHLELVRNRGGKGAKRVAPRSHAARVVRAG